MSPKRRRRGPVVVRVANCQSVSAGPEKARGIFKAGLGERGVFGAPDVVLACEAADVAAELAAESRQWHAAQLGRPRSPEAGVAIAWSPEGRLLRRPRLIPGAAAGEGIRARPFLQLQLAIHGHEPWLNAGHAPPDRAPVGQRTYLERLRRVRGVVGLDANRRPGEIAAMHYHRRYVGHDLLGLFVPIWISASLPKPIDIGGDHKAVDVQLWPDLLRHRLEREHRIPHPG